MSTTPTDGGKEPVDPRKRFPAPPFAQLPQTAPGNEAKMHPRPDHGEESYTGSGKLLGRAALITGADSGIGRAVALCFAKEGADILFTCLPEERADADETIRLVEATGRRAVAVPGDIRQKAFCQQLVEQTVSTFGRLDILVNNAAYQRSHDKLEEFTEDEFDATYRTNVYGTFFMTQAAVPKMKPGGVVLNTVSIQGYEPSENLMPYASTKAALISLTKSSAKLAMANGVRVKRGGSRAGLDAADSGHDGAHRDGHVWQANGVRASGAAGGAGGDLRVPGFGRGQLHHRGNLRGHGRPVAGLTRWMDDVHPPSCTNGRSWRRRARTDGESPRAAFSSSGDTSARYCG